MKDDLKWTYLTNHTHVLLCIFEDPTTRIRDIAQRVGITERAVQKLVSELETAGVLVRNRAGRRNQYQIIRSHTLRHEITSHQTIGSLLTLLSPKGAARD